MPAQPPGSKVLVGAGAKLLTRAGGRVQREGSGEDRIVGLRVGHDEPQGDCEAGWHQCFTCRCTAAHGIAGLDHETVAGTAAWTGHRGLGRRGTDGGTQASGLGQRDTVEQWPTSDVNWRQPAHDHISVAAHCSGHAARRRRHPARIPRRRNPSYGTDRWRRVNVLVARLAGHPMQSPASRSITRPTAATVQTPGANWPRPRSVRNWCWPGQWRCPGKATWARPRR